MYLYMVLANPTHVLTADSFLTSHVTNCFPSNSNDGIYFLPDDRTTQLAQTPFPYLGTLFVATSPQACNLPASLQPPHKLCSLSACKLARQQAACRTCPSLGATHPSNTTHPSVLAHRYFAPSATRSITHAQSTSAPLTALTSALHFPTSC
jgi:hypothetical protein